MKFITLILKNPFRNKTRSALSIIGIAIGIATIVALGLITAGMEDSVQTTFNEGGAEITITNATNVGGSSGLLSMSLIDELKNMTNVSDAVGQLSVSESNQSFVQSRSPVLGTTVYGLNASKLNLIGIKNVNGTTYKEGSFEAIIGSRYADLNNLTVGSNLSFLGHNFKIVGIYETGSMMTDNGVYVSLKTLQNISNTEAVSSILVKTSEGVNDTLVSKNIKEKFGNLTTLTSEEMSSMFNDVIAILDAASFSISGLAIIVGAIGVINTMVMTVYERTKEIGVLKSIGWKSRKILTMILGETLVLTTLSGIIGSVFGILIAEVGVRLMGTDGFSLVYTPKTFIIAFGITIIVGIIGGVYPAYKASKLAPTEALRYE
ncbi:MAG: ABC transporter permease [Methanobrevibacter sp.]|nr:ABC transporter permease [Methanobrevibacter sp.]